MTKTAARTFRAIFFHDHVSNLTCCSCCAMIYFSVDQQRATNAAPKTQIQHYSFADASSLALFSQSRSICIVIYYTGNCKFFSKIILKGKIIPAVSVIERTYHTMSRIHQPTDSDAHAQNTSIKEAFRASHIGKHFIQKLQNGSCVRDIFQRSSNTVQNFAAQICQSN